MLIRFWGTRGSLPAPLNHRAVRAKVRDALLAARRRRRFEGPEAVEAFIDRELPFSVGGTYGGNTSCVELVTGGDEFVLCDVGSGAREFGNSILARYGPARKHRFQHLHVASALGPHHGVPVLHPRLHPGQRDPHSRLP